MTSNKQTLSNGRTGKELPNTHLGQLGQTPILSVEQCFVCRDSVSSDSFRSDDADMSGSSLCRQKITHMNTQIHAHTGCDEGTVSHESDLNAR